MSTVGLGSLLPTNGALGLPSAPYLGIADGALGLPSARWRRHRAAIEICDDDASRVATRRRLPLAAIGYFGLGASSVLVFTSQHIDYYY